MRLVPDHGMRSISSEIQKLNGIGQINTSYERIGFALGGGGVRGNLASVLITWRSC